MRIYFLLVFIMLNVPAFSQSGDTVFTVKAVSVSVLPQADILYKNKTKKLRIVKPANTQIANITFAGGTLTWNDSLIYLKATQTQSAMLRIYVKQQGGKSALAFVKEYKVQAFTEPKPNLDGVDNDSAIHRMKVTVQGYIGVPLHPEPALKRISYPIVSFEMLTPGGGRLDTARVSGNRLTYEMRDKIDKMPEGSVIEISNIKYLVEQDTFTVQQPLRVYLINPPVNKF